MSMPYCTTLRSPTKITGFPDDSSRRRCSRNATSHSSTLYFNLTSPSPAFGVYHETKWKLSNSQLMTLPSASCVSFPKPYVTRFGRYFVRIAVPEYPFRGGLHILKNPEYSLGSCLDSSNSGIAVGSILVSLKHAISGSTSLRNF